MTTKDSPPAKLKAQAYQMARTLKARERGDQDIAARMSPSIKFAVAMDDKIIKIEMAWTQIAETSEAAIAEYILRYMREEKLT